MLNNIVVKIVFLVVCTQVNLSVASAADRAELSKAIELLEIGNSERALELLEATHAIETTSIQELFLLGIAAKRSGKLTKAENYFQRALAKRGNAGRIKLELAEVLVGQGKLDAAKTELQGVLVLNPPDSVKENVERLIAQIDRSRQSGKNEFAINRVPKNWTGYASLGIIYDSNVNASTDSDSVTFFGLPFTLSDDARETKDGAWTLRSGYRHRWFLGEKTVWDIGLHGAFTDYFSVDVYDYFSLSVAAGPRFAVSENATISVPITLDTLSFTDTDEGLYSVFYGTSPRIDYQFSDDFRASLTTTLNRKAYLQSRERDSSLLSIAPSMRWKPFDELGYFNAGLSYGRENSGEDIFSYDAFGASLGYEHEIQTLPLKAGLTASYSNLRFDGIQSAQTEAREDQTFSLSGTLSYNLKPSEKLGFTQNSAVSLDLTYTENQSNLEINDFDRTKLTIAFTKQF